MPEGKNQVGVYLDDDEYEAWQALSSRVDLKMGRLGREAFRIVLAQPSLVGDAITAAAKEETK